MKATPCAIADVLLGADTQPLLSQVRLLWPSDVWALLDPTVRAALDGAGIMSLPLDIAAPYLSQGTLVRVLSPWITGRLALYAALPSRKFIPDRTRVFLEYLIEQTKLQTDKALKAFTSTKADSVG